MRDHGDKPKLFEYDETEDLHCKFGSFGNNACTDYANALVYCESHLTHVQ